jgi:hypothetical protein
MRRRPALRPPRGWPGLRPAMTGKEARPMACNRPGAFTRAIADGGFLPVMAGHVPAIHVVLQA